MSGNLAKSGTHQLELIGETYDALICGQRQVLSTSQVPLTADSTPCFSVLLQAALDNTAYVYVGNETQGCYIELDAGATVTIPINDLNKVYVRAASGTQFVNWIAVR